MAIALLSAQVLMLMTMFEHLSKGFLILSQILSQLRHAIHVLEFCYCDFTLFRWHPPQWPMSGAAAAMHGLPRGGGPFLYYL